MACLNGAIHRYRMKFAVFAAYAPGTADVLIHLQGPF
jgi:hypothetical protein